MKNDQQEAFERVLSSTLARVIDFLKYAEAKNAALLTFASAWILASINLLNGSIDLSSDWKLAFTIALPFFATAGLFAIFSLLPKMDLSHFHKDPDQGKALLYFAHAAKFAPAAYKDRIRERYYPADDQSVTQNYLDDLSIQIAVNSAIVTRKLKIFHRGAFITLIALAILATPVIPMVWHEILPHLGVQ